MRASTTILSSLSETLMNYPTLHHYSKEPMHAVGSVSPIHPEGKHKAGAHKPLGFWVSDDNDFGWAEWCEGERFGDYKYRYLVELARPDDLLWVRSLDALKAFSNEHCEPAAWTEGMAPSRRDYYREPRWGRLATKYAGVIITPYQWELRLADGFMWYYGWDCASGVIWDGSVVASVSEVPMVRNPWADKSVAA